MYVWLKEEEIVFLYRILEIHFSKGKSMYTRTDWEITHLKHHVELGWRLKKFFFFFWISLHQGTHFLLCSRIQGYMLSLMNKVDPCVAYVVGFVWDAKLVFPTIGIRKAYIDAVKFKTKEVQTWEDLQSSPRFHICPRCVVSQSVMYALV